ncbi:hypothetical protein ES703_125872 [subsurface metagenome]
MPARGERRSCACHRQRTERPGKRDRRAPPCQPRHQHGRDRKQQRWPEARIERSPPWRGRDQAPERQAKEIDALQTKRRKRANYASIERAENGACAGLRLPDPGRKEDTANAGKQSKINAHPGKPYQDGERPILGPRSSGACRRSDREHDRSPDGMAVLGDDAVADELRALRQVVGKGNQERLIDGPSDYLARLAFGIDQADRCGRHGFVEAQLHHLRRLREHGVIAGIGRNQRGVGMRRVGQEERQQYSSNAAGDAHRCYGFVVSLSPGAGDLLSSWPPCPSLGMSIQRFTPCSHS